MPHVHNALHHATRLQDTYRVALGESDPNFTGIERGGETITPVVDLWGQPEWALPLGTVLYARNAESNAGAGFSSIELVNPAGSRILAVVSAVYLMSRAEFAVDSGAALGVISTLRGVALDTRFASLGETSRCTVVTGNLAGAASLPQLDVGAAGVNIRVEVPFILTPGRKLFIMAAAAATSCIASIVWRERTATDAELGSFGR